MSTTLALISRFIRVEVEIRRWEDYLILMPAASDLSTARVLDFSLLTPYSTYSTIPLDVRVSAKWTSSMVLGEKI